MPNPHKEWQVVLSFKISGNYYTGGRGIAFWYTKDRGNPGPIIGNQDKWVGLAIFFETAAPSIGVRTVCVMSITTKETDSAQSDLPLIYVCLM